MNGAAWRDGDGMCSNETWAAGTAAYWIGILRLHDLNLATHFGSSLGLTLLELLLQASLFLG